MRPKAPEIGTTIMEAGRVKIYSGTRWLDYPVEAAKLIDEAIACGWGFDDGMPIRHLADGTAYVRVLVGREPGIIADGTDGKSDGWQFHVTFTIRETGAGWDMNKGYHKTSSGEGGWLETSSLRYIRQTMHRYRVTPDMSDVPVSA